MDTRPSRNTLATVSYQLFLIDSSTLDSRLIETITNESFFVGEYDILPAIDITIQLMDRGEHAIIDSDIRHCYGENGCEEKGIPPITSENTYRMKIDLELHDWKYPEKIQTLTINERINWRFISILFYFLQKNFFYFYLVIKNDNEEIFYIVEKNIYQQFNVIKML